MTTTNAVFFDTQSLPAVDTAMFESDSNGAGSIIDKFSVLNTDVGNQVVTVRLVPPSETPTGDDFVMAEKTITPGQTYLFPELVGQFLSPGAAIWVQASAAGVVNGRASGRNFTT